MVRPTRGFLLNAHGVARLEPRYRTDGREERPKKKSHKKSVLLLFFLVVGDEFKNASIGVIHDIKGGVTCQGNRNNACQVHIRDCSHDTFKKEVKSR